MYKTVFQTLDEQYTTAASSLKTQIKALILEAFKSFDDISEATVVFVLDFFLR